MKSTFSPEAQKLMNERFGHDTLIALATSADDRPSVRAVNSYYENGSFYIITYALSRKMSDIASNPRVAVCGDWFSGDGVGENMGYILAPENAHIADKLREAFSSWYDNGHNDYSDHNTIILRVRLKRGILFSHGTRYDITFEE